MGIERARAHLPGMLGHLGYLRQESVALRIEPRRFVRDVSLPAAASTALPVDVERVPSGLASERTSNLLLCNWRRLLRSQHDQLCNRHVAG